MCEPTTIMAASLALTAVSTGMGIYGNMVQQDAAMEREQQNFLATAEANRRNYELQDAALTQKQNEINLQAYSQETELERQMRRERARLQVAAGESGVGGVLAARLQRNVEMAESLEASTIETNRQNQNAQVQFEKGMEKERAKMPTLYQAKMDPTWSMVSGALSIGGQAAGAYGNYKARQATGKTNVEK